MARELASGAKAPAFTLPRDGGETISLADFAGRKLVLYFYPRADTPGCTKEAMDFSRLKAAFAKAETDVLGVSADPVPTRTSSRASISSPSRLPPTKRTARWRPMACGRRSRCMGGSSWVLSAPRS